MANEGVTRNTSISPQSGFSIVETLITMALVGMVGAFVFPIFARMAVFSKGSHFKENCQRIVSSKISFYNSLTRDQLIERYNQYRGGSYGPTPGAHPLCGTPSSLGGSLFRSKISSFIVENNIYKYGQSPELGLRECVELSQYPVQDVQKLEKPGKPYPPEFCLQGSNLRPSDLQASTQIPGLKSYVRMRLLGGESSADPWACPGNLDLFQSYLNQSLEIQVTAVADYLSVGNSDAGGVVDPNALMCSSRTTFSMMKNQGPLAFRYFAAQVGSPPVWRIHRVSDGWKDVAATEIYHSLSNAMNSQYLVVAGGSTLPVGGVVTQFGINPKGDLGFFIKAYENFSDPYFPLTSVLCVLSGIGETTTSYAQPFCRILPRMPENQIESILVDWKKGKMWGVNGRISNPNRALTPPVHQEINSSYLIADCSGVNEQYREKALFLGTPACVSSDPGAGYTAMPSPVPVGDGGTITDMSFSNARKLDSDFLNQNLASIHSPDVTPRTGAPSKSNHMDALSLRYLDEIFSPTHGALFTVSTSPPRNCGAPERCMTQARARLFFSPDGLTSYALMRYPGVTSEAGCNFEESEKQAQIFRLEFSRASGASNAEATVCPEMVMNLKKGNPGVELLPELFSY